jgi:membrane-bound acyltransferase YfiQ involved in biofilm formation
VDFTASTVVFFIGVYSVGLWLGHDVDARVRLVLRWRATLIGVAVATTAALALLTAEGFEWVGPVSVQQSLFYVQKLCIAGLVLVVLQRYRTRVPPLLDALARHAFAIYFLHAF